MPDTTIPAVVDLQLRGMAERAAAQYPDQLLETLGWTRPDYVAAIHTRLRHKFRQWCAEGRLIADANGQYRTSREVN